MDRVDDLLDDEEETPAPPDNASAAQTRLDREKAKLKKEVEDLRGWKAEREKTDRAASVAETFKDIGLNPKHAKFYQAEDASPEAIKAWAVEEDFLQLGEGEQAPVAPSTGFTPTVIPGGLPLGAKMYSPQEWAKASVEDPILGQRLLAEGRVTGAQVQPDGKVTFPELRQGLGLDR